MLKKNALIIISILAVLGILDSLYLTYEHYANVIPPCSGSIFVDCGKVLKSKYSVVFGLPLSLYGFFYYFTVFVVSILANIKKAPIFKRLIILISSIGFLFSFYLMYLQLIVIGSICLYCTASAVTSTTIFFTAFIFFEKDRKFLSVYKTQILYKNILRPLLFLIDSEKVHNAFVAMGKIIGKTSFFKKIFRFWYLSDMPVLSQKIDGVEFKNPVGLAAGFDYDADLTQIIPQLDFGFQTVGTVTRGTYEGNPKPRLGRLPRSRSLLVNKGFKSSGAEKISKKLEGLNFEIPTGISIGRTNSPKLKTQKESVDDIISAFKTFEKANTKNAYYELNISCPNLIHGNVSFYPSKNLDELLTAIDKLKLKKPLFIKMPIEKSNSETLKMLDVIAKHSPAGVIFGNLQRDKDHPHLDKGEANKFKMGSFSGKPTFDRSNELIELAYKNYKRRFVIIGCGGIFNVHDAYEKIIRGASLVQLITGLIFEGPLLAAKINLELEEVVKTKEIKNIKHLVGMGLEKQN